MARTITCSCGEALSSDDEEELYSFTRAHAEQLHPEPMIFARQTAWPSEPGTGPDYFRSIPSWHGTTAREYSAWR